ncbi:hypothetical protein PAMP_019281 [Pampus punctatissimus]
MELSFEAGEVRGEEEMEEEKEKEKEEEKRIQVREEESGPRAAIILSQQEFKPSDSSTGLPTQSWTHRHNSSSYCSPPFCSGPRAQLPPT